MLLFKQTKFINNYWNIYKNNVTELVMLDICIDL